MQHLVLSIKSGVHIPPGTVGQPQTLMFLSLAYNLPGLSCNNCMRHQFGKKCSSEQIYMSKQSDHQRTFFFFFTVYLFLFSGFLLSVDLTNMTMSIEYKNLFTRCSNAICKTENTNAVLESNLCFVYILSLQCVTSVLNKQLKKYWI